MENETHSKRREKYSWRKRKKEKREEERRKGGWKSIRASNKRQKI